MSKLETKVVYNHPKQEAVGAVIWLHGLGADYNDFVQIVPELRLSESVKFVFPNAPVIPVTVNNGYHMRAWYDILNFNDLHREVDSNGIIINVEHINTLIDDLINSGIPAGKIIMAGFSQGGVISYYTALKSKYNLGGLLVLSSYLPDLSLLSVEEMQHKKELPILVCHGTQDPVVRIEYARQAIQYLQSFNLSYQWLEYPMEHSVCYDEIVAIGAWMKQIFAK